MSAATRRGNWHAVFGPPIVVAILSFAGLLAALLWEESAAFAWAAVAVPIMICGWACIRQRLATSRRRR